MALRRIALADFVIVQSLDLDLPGGFTVLTGETGAGKSILIDALQFLLGARADTGVIREGAPRTEVTAEFDAATAPLRAWLEAADIALEDSLLLRRTLDAQGRSRAWINGSAATAAQMRELGEHLLDIHGQHAWQSLTRPDAVRSLLDAYAGAPPQALAALWADWRGAQRTLEQARAAQDTLAQERERLQWQIAELDKLAPHDGEWETLNARHARLSNAQALIDSAQGVLAALQGGDDDAGGGALSSLAQAQQLLEGHVEVAEEFRAAHDLLQSCLAQAGDVAHSLHGYLRHAEPDPEQLQQLDNRLAQWLQLARRYRRQPQELPALLADWQEQLQRLDAASDLAALQVAEETHGAAYLKAARALSQQRRKAAPRLAQAITAAMQGLGMIGGRFEVQVDKAPDPGAHGLDQVVFLVSSHPGMTPRPVGKVASGGELSRIALAISVTTSELGEAPTLIFDEVDAGVGGAVAQTVGELMRQLGRARQVLAVTHLPQVAACADAHLRVAKQRQQGSTHSSVTPVQHEERVHELARMLGGAQLSPATLAHAREMLGATITGAPS